MSFNDDTLKAKLSTLNETQDSIVTVSQWIMFHRSVVPGDLISTQAPSMLIYSPSDDMRTA